jgi:hypothetical protein
LTVFENLLRKVRSVFRSALSNGDVEEYRAATALGVLPMGVEEVLQYSRREPACVLRCLEWMVMADPAAMPIKPDHV